MGEANIWQPRSILEADANSRSLAEKLTASADQTLFTLTSFAYVVGTGSLEVHKNGLLLTKGTDWQEQTTTTFSIVVPCTAGDIVVATGIVGNTANVDVRDTDIYESNYQAIRDYAGTEVTLYSQGRVTNTDAGDQFFNLVTGAAPGFYVDNDDFIIVPTGGDGSSAWVNTNKQKLINNLSKTHNFLTAAAYKAFTFTFPLGKKVYLADRDAEFTVISGTGTGNDIDIIASTQVNQSVTIAASGIIDNAALASPSTGPLNTIGCAVKINPQAIGVDNTFAFVDDSQHDPINSTAVAGDANSVNVTHVQPAGSAVVGATIAAPDETLIKRGIMVGGSIGTEISVITMAKRHSIKLDWAAGALDANDLVVDAFIDPSRYVVGDNTGTTGAFRINHPETLDGLRTVNPIGFDSPDTVLAEVLGNTVDLFPYKQVRLTATRAAGVWTVAGSNPTETAALAALGFTVTDSGNIITVNHPTVLSGNAQAQAQFVGINYYRFCNIVTGAATKSTMVLLNNAGTPQPPTNGDVLYITLHEVLWKYGFSSLDLGIIELNPLKDFKDISAGNNFWLLGNHWALK